MKTHEQLRWEFLLLSPEEQASYTGPLQVIPIPGTNKVLLYGGK